MLVQGIFKNDNLVSTSWKRNILCIMLSVCCVYFSSKMYFSSNFNNSNTAYVIWFWQCDYVWPANFCIRANWTFTEICSIWIWLLFSFYLIRSISICDTSKGKAGLKNTVSSSFLVASRTFFMNRSSQIRMDMFLLLSFTIWK